LFSTPAPASRPRARRHPDRGLPRRRWMAGAAPARSVSRGARPSDRRGRRWRKYFRRR